MELISGIAKRVHQSAKMWSGLGAPEVLQVVSLQIERRAIELSLRELPQIVDGDELAVAGDLKRGVLVGLAFVNRSNGTYGRHPESAVKGCATVLFMFFLCGIVAALAPFLFPFVAIAVFALVPSIRRGTRASKALRMVQRARLEVVVAARPKDLRDQLQGSVRSEDNCWLRDRFDRTYRFAMFLNVLVSGVLADAAIAFSWRFIPPLKPA